MQGVLVGYNLYDKYGCESRVAPGKRAVEKGPPREKGNSNWHKDQLRGNKAQLVE